MGSSHASEALGVQSLTKDLGNKKEVVMHTDSSAALSLAQRTGLGRAKHIDIQWLWIQEASRDRRLTIKKVASSSNPADIATKALAGERILHLMHLLNHRLLPHLGRSHA